MSLWSAAGAAAGYFFGGPAGAAIGAKIGGTMDTNNANKDIAASNNAWSANQYATRYQTQVKDIEAAGLNPMLAYSQSPGTAPSAQAVQFQNPFSDIGQTVQQFSSANQADATVKQIEATTEKIIEETKNIPLEGDKIRFTIQKLAEEAANIAQRTQSEVKSRELMTAQINEIASKTTLLNNQIEVEKALENLGRTSKEYQPVVKMMLDIFRTMSK